LTGLVGFAGVAGFVVSLIIPSVTVAVGR
jgi:hypothetical protein